MMCNCIKELEEQIKQEHDADWVIKEGYTDSTFRMRLYRADGEISKVNRYESVDWKFCPFCGENFAEAERAKKILTKKALSHYEPKISQINVDRKLALLEEKFKKGLISAGIYQRLKDDYLNVGDEI